MIMEFWSAFICLKVEMISASEGSPILAVAACVALAENSKIGQILVLQRNCSMSWLDNVLDGIDKWNKGQTNPTTSVNRTNPSPPKLSHKTTTKPASRHVAKKMKIDEYVLLV